MEMEKVVGLGLVVVQVAHSPSSAFLEVHEGLRSGRPSFSSSRSFLTILSIVPEGEHCGTFQVKNNSSKISPALQPNSKRTICDWQRLGPAAWISHRVLPTWFPESKNRPHIRAGVLKISRGTDNVKSGCTHRQPTRKRTCANLLTIVPTVIAAQ